MAHQPLSARDLMTAKVYTVGSNDSLATAYDLMDSLNVRHLPVIDRSGDLIGLITQWKLLQIRSAVGADLPVAELRQFLDSRSVSEAMVEEVETIDPETDIEEAGRIILENKIACLPVVEGERLVGVLTEADFVRYLVEHADELGPRQAA